ncbi:MAG: hypothetical protein WBE11_14440, partial [Candidatus Aminicenantaceae bacterium]
HHPLSELFIKAADKFILKELSISYCQHLLPFGRTDLTASASLQLIRGSSLQLHEPLPRRYCNLGP